MHFLEFSGKFRWEDIAGKAHVIYRNQVSNINAWLNEGPNRFFVETPLREKPPSKTVLPVICLVLTNLHLYIPNYILSNFRAVNRRLSIPSCPRLRNSNCSTCSAAPESWHTGCGNRDWSTSAGALTPTRTAPTHSRPISLAPLPWIWLSTIFFSTCRR